MSTMTYEEIRYRVDTEDDFIALKRFDYSLKALMLRYPDGIPSDRLIAQALAISEEELESIYEGVVKKLKTLF